MEIMFSVIVPVYRVSDYLEKCIESILQQTYQDFELILVDDGSPDDCPQICDKYAQADSRIRVIHKENGGLVSARQAGAKEANGDYICCIDGDDWVAPDYLESFAKSIKLCNADIVCCNSYLAQIDGNKECKSGIAPGVYDRARIEKELFPLLLENEKNQYFPPSLCMKAIRRNLFQPEQAEVDPSIVIGEDRAVEIPCVCRSNYIVMLDDCLYYYRVNTQSMTRNKKGFSWDSLEAFALHLPRRLDLNEYDFQAQYDRLITHQFFLTAKSQFNRDEPYSVIRREILNKMNEPVFAGPIQRCHFSGSVRAKLMECCLKQRMIFLISMLQKVS